MPDFRVAPFFALPLAALLAGCSLGSAMDSTLGLGGPSGAAASQSMGLAVGDEPFAVKTGTAILGQGGSAADAVTAMFFAMSATYPVAVGLGGGGICLISDPVKGVREFDFLPRAASSGGTYAVPGAVRGFYDLQSAFGTLPWQRTVSGGEAYAASGFPISHALWTRLGNAQNSVRLDAALAAEFMNENGTPRPEGAIATNLALSQTLAAIRLSGPDGFYKGAVADGLVRYSASQGGAISAADLADYRTTVTAPRLMNQGGYSVALPNAATGAGQFAQSLFTNAARSADAEASVVLAVRQSLASFGVSTLPSDLGGTGFAAVDRNGQVATCAMTLNGAFGAGHTAGGSGVLLANSPSAPAGIAGAFLTPLIARDGNGRAVLTGVGAGGPNGTAAIAYAFLKLAGGQQIGRPADMRSTGAAPMVTVNVISCQTVCVALPDPGGHGLGAATSE
ncbi:MAG: gamma-glutamyltransferase [Alphaproteobacteria bacterium]|nr:gamma-glutamyltransferase [Alphaproteobacteria bacterium]